MLTAGTFQKEHIFNTAEKRDILQSELLSACDQHLWQPMAWALFANHYHIVISSEHESANISKLAAQIHGKSARRINLLDKQVGRKVWFQFWDTELKDEKAVYARLSYVHFNAVRHGLVKRPEDYPHSSAFWFLSTADASFRKTVLSFPHDKIFVPDDY